MNLVEPIADAATGSVLSRAAEPATGVDSGGHTTEQVCLNCRVVLLGSYCHHCGQKGHIHRSLDAFGHDLLHGILHLEGKVWRTLPLLVWRPGDLTRRYVVGERARFVGPLPLFLFCVFLMFAVVSTTGGINVNTTKSKAQLQKAIIEGQADVAKLEGEVAAARREGARARAALIQGRLEAEQESLAEARALLAGATPAQAERAAAAAVSKRPLDDANSMPSNTGVGWFDQLSVSYERAYLAAKKNPELMIFKLKSNGYKYSWALIPLSLPLMWILFPFSRRFRLYDHAVFVTYSLCFMTLLVTVGGLIATTRAGPAAVLLLLVPPLHMYRQLRGAYQLTWLSALWRSLLLVSGAFVIATLFMLGIITLGVYD